MRADGSAGDRAVRGQGLPQGSELAELWPAWPGFIGFPGPGPWARQGHFGQEEATGIHRMSSSFLIGPRNQSLAKASFCSHLIIKMIPLLVPSPGLPAPDSPGPIIASVNRNHWYLLHLACQLASALLVATLRGVPGSLSPK